MIQIRPGVFETNSSSTHSLVMCTADEYQQFKDGELLLSRWDDCLKTLEETRKTLRNDQYYTGPDPDTLDAQELCDQSDGQYQTFLSYMQDTYLDTFEEEYTTPLGERVVAFGTYGFDG